MLKEYHSLIKAAGERVYALARKTPLQRATALSKRYRRNIYLKREDQQPGFSYKLRGAYNFIASLDESQRHLPVIAASAGNHAQGVALAVQHLGMQAIIVMPRTTPEIKIEAVRSLGGAAVTIRLHGDTYDDAKVCAVREAAKHNYILVPTYDHPLVIAGQGTVGVEIAEQQKKIVDIVFVPVGGGGLIAGIAAHLKLVQPQTRIIGVEPDEAPCMGKALQQQKLVRLEKIGIFADGAAVAEAGTETFRIAREHVDDMLQVSVDDICAAVKDLFEDTRVIAEPAGALALAGLKQYLELHPDDNGTELVAVFSGANVNFDRLRHIAELATLGEHQEALLAAAIPEEPGSFKNFCRAMGERQITEFNYRYSSSTKAHVFAGVQLKNGLTEKKKLLAELNLAGYEVTDLSGNELAKMHIRHAIGGHAPQAGNEQIHRFEFPERSGALLQFLERLGTNWNISLFHYRNHGAAYGRVMIGIQVPPEQLGEFHNWIEKLGLKSWDETNNDAVALFLGQKD